MGTDKDFSGMLSFGGESNGKPSTWNTEDQTEIYTLWKYVIRKQYDGVKPTDRLNFLTHLQGLT